MLKIGCVVLAAGKGERFGGNKLLADFRGKPLIQYAFEAIPPALPTAVVSRYPEILKMAEERGFLPIENARPELGQSHSLHLGLEAMQDMDGVLFLVGDQPLIKRESIKDLIELFKAQPQRIVAPAFHGRRGNPVLFPKDLFPALLALQGDRGGSAVLKAHPERLLLYAVDDPLELQDVDEPESLCLLNRKERSDA